ncbi:alpha/beta hydrolase [Bacillus atrophaeus]|uniref:alpha/beta fold hydrolase n=1 Tax=Bacillus atrophaeus TaxID=1452 RepID=UPI0022830CAF|nr:alpha/beta hydrolase [Bacillus atrophaeus]MCY8918732.1 alpha/beta hydrolase [Bacillus atrophaeus]MCY8927028.1 alpha/beta hydrolase [Bacillus atrophaeus]
MKRHVETITIDGKTIEYSITGKGIPILIMHGGHSNCYEEFGYSALTEKGFSLITPSRAGYGNTSKEIGESLASTCLFYVKLLDHLRIKEVHLLAISAGGPSGITFASHYPEKVKTLTLQSAVTKEWLTPKDKQYKAAKLLFRPPAEKWLWRWIIFTNNAFPHLTFKLTSPFFSMLSYDQIKMKMKEDDEEQFRLMNNRQRPGYGFMTDLSQMNMVSSDDLKAISCPALIMHSQYDGLVPLEHAYHAHKLIPQSELCLLQSWGHLIWLGKESDEVDHTLATFLSSSS